MTDAAKNISPVPGSRAGAGTALGARIPVLATGQASDEARHFSYAAVVRYAYRQAAV